MFHPDNDGAKFSKYGLDAICILKFQQSPEAFP